MLIATEIVVNDYHNYKGNNILGKVTLIYSAI